MNTILKSTASWGMLFCALAAISHAFPWSYTFSYAIASLQTGSPQQIMIPVSAYTDWHGAAITVVSGVGLLFLVATGSLRPAPWWRTLGIAIVGTAIIAITIIYSTDHWNHFPVQEFGGLMAIISATGLLFVACLDVRQSLKGD
jgi:hypothetical protein